MEHGDSQGRLSEQEAEVLRLRAELERAERELRDSEARHEGLRASLPVAVFLKTWMGISFM